LLRDFVHLSHRDIDLIDTGALLRAAADISPMIELTRAIASTISPIEIAAG